MRENTPITDNIGKGEGMDRKDHATRRLLTRIALIALFLYAVINFSPLGSFFSLLLDITAPITIGLSIAFIINIPLCFFERLFDKAIGTPRAKWLLKLRRALCLLLCFILLLGIIIALCFAIIPQLKLSANALLDALPVISEQLIAHWERFSAFLGGYGITLPTPDFSIEGMLGLVRSAMLGRESAIINKSIGMAGSVFSRFFDVSLALVICVYVLARKEMLAKQCRRFLRAFLPSTACDRFFEIAGLSARTFTSFVSGQVFEAALLGVLCFLGMLLFGMPYPALISVVVGVSALIPIFGAFFGICVGTVFILVSDPSMAIWFVLFLLVLQQIESNVIYPRVIGKYVGLPAVWVLLSVTVGSAFGVVGILFSVPLFSVIYSLLGQFVKKRER